MKPVASFFACALLTVSLAGFSASAALAAQGQDFPDTTCTCKGCGTGGGDLTGNCASVCKDKTVFSKGSEPHDYCKKAATMTGNGLASWTDARWNKGRKARELFPCPYVDHQRHVSRGQKARAGQPQDSAQGSRRAEGQRRRGDY